jgi:hypothetical protein
MILARILLITSFTCSSGCNVSINGGFGPPIVGSGVEKKDARQVADFTRVELRSFIAATVTVGEKPSLTIVGDDNIVPLVVSRVKDGVLEILVEAQQPIQVKNSLQALITTPKLESVLAEGVVKATCTLGETASFRAEASGASTITLEKVQSGSLELVAEGASTVYAKGKTESLKAEALGASTVSAPDLQAEKATVSIEGASTGKLRVSGSVDGSVDGASNATISGGPKTRSVSTTGASSVSYKD